MDLNASTCHHVRCACSWDSADWSLGAEETTKQQATHVDGRGGDPSSMVKETKRRQSVHVDGGDGDLTPTSPIRLPPHLCLRPEPPHPRPHPRMPPHFRPPLPEPSRRLPISDLCCRGRCLYLHAVASACLPIFGPLYLPPPRLRSALSPSPPPPPRTASACLPISFPFALSRAVVPHLRYAPPLPPPARRRVPPAFPSPASFTRATACPSQMCIAAASTPTPYPPPTSPSPSPPPYCCSLSLNSRSPVGAASIPADSLASSPPPPTRTRR